MNGMLVTDNNLSLAQGEKFCLGASVFIAGELEDRRLS